MPLWNEYYLPVSVDEAVGLLARHDGKARVVAGGTDLILDLQQGNEHPVEALVDVTHIVGLNEIREANGYLTIGAGVTHNQIVESALLQHKATALVEASMMPLPDACIDRLDRHRPAVDLDLLEGHLAQRQHDRPCLRALVIAVADVRRVLRV